MKKLLLAFFVFSLACSANAADYYDGQTVLRSLMDACSQCQGDANCKVQVNLAKSNIVANNPDLANANHYLKNYKCD